MKEINRQTQDMKFLEFEEEMDRRYDVAFKKAMKRAEEDGLWEKIKNNSPEDICIEIEGTYPELFADYEKYLEESRHKQGL